MTHHPMNPVSIYRTISVSEYLNRNALYWKRLGPDKAEDWVNKYGPVIARAFEEFEEKNRSKA